MQRLSDDGKGSSVKESWWEGGVRDGRFTNLGPFVAIGFSFVAADSKKVEEMRTMTKGGRHDLLQEGDPSHNAVQPG